jgi:hypothetical protein
MLADHAQVFSRLYEESGWSDFLPGSTPAAARPHRGLIEPCSLQR